MGNGYNADPPIYWDGSGEVNKDYTQESNQSDVSQGWSEAPQQQWSDYNHSIGGYYVYPDVYQPDYTGTCQEAYYDSQYATGNDMLAQDSQQTVDTMAPSNEGKPEKPAPKKKKTPKVQEKPEGIPEVDPTPEELLVLKLLDQAKVEMVKEKELLEQEKDETDEMKRMDKDRVDKERRKLEALRSAITDPNDLEAQKIIEKQRIKLRHVKDTERCRNQRKTAPTPPPEVVERRRAIWAESQRLRYKNLTVEQREKKRARGKAAFQAAQAKIRQEKAEKAAAKKAAEESKEPTEPEMEEQDDGGAGEHETDPIAH
ncbi:hypothetical protein CAEBREN_20823 [Caenorhabditis brenneri]|uniref:Uncharacterized protein n=1 Tax=Caenorhabditis brenneri TaxID=135651 RepID=G0NBW3_CAEBE|nr:hypothetical protein CAEBREN_20823 [Caenorhabditis brenneri]